MEFDFNETQYLFRDTVRDFLRDRLSPTALRAIWDEAHHYDHRVWRQLADMGIAGLLVDADHGGLGASPVDAILILEECGAFALPEPVVETALIAPLLLAEFGTEAQQAAWLPGIAAGEVLVAVADTAQAAIVPDGLGADLVVVVHDDGVHLVERDGVRGRPLRGADPSRRLAECSFDLGPSTLLSADPASTSLVARVGATGTAALLVGLSQQLLTMTRDYVLTRQQFGRAVGGFQAVKHRLADVAVQVEAARSLTWNAGYRLGTDTDAVPSAAALAKGAASRAGAVANAAALQLHGGIGFTWEHDLHLWLQRGKAWEQAFGDTVHHRQTAGADRLGVA